MLLVKGELNPSSEPTSSLSLQKVVSPAQRAGQTDIIEALQFSNVIIQIIDDYINEDLPVAAKKEGEDILKNVKTALKVCEEKLKTPLDIGTYNECADEQLRKALGELANLQKVYRPLSHATSGAPRLQLFLWL